jgi:predicted nucleotide-binding protein (sugar kinase/HSP70/actin superfamily)
MWRAFLETLGLEVVVSSESTKRTVRVGTELGENELCLPVKVFFGHVKELDGTVDFLFVPRVVAVEETRYTCPKFLGLPDLARSLELETEVVGPTLTLREGRRRFLADSFRLGRELGGGKLQTIRAIRAGLAAHKAHERRFLAGDHLRLPEPETGKTGLRIGVAGHPYIIYDSQISLDLVPRLAERGIEVLTPEMLDEKQIERATEDVPKSVFWSYENELVGAVHHWLDHSLVDGIIYVLSFACGPDSFVQVLIEDAVKERGNGTTVPLMPLVIDEHSGEAGFVTRIEAFLDMLARRENAEPEAISA